MVHFITALPCEARPLIDRYRLKAAGHHGRIALYAGEFASLAVSGVGSIQSAIAAGAIRAALPGDDSDLWINLGLCGHRELPIGTAILTNRVSSPSQREVFYPSLLSESPFTQTGLQTVSQPSSQYPENDAVDMEAYGCFQSCLHFTSLERIHAIKVVSDNAEQPAKKRFDKAWVSDLIAAQLDTIDSYARSLHEKLAGPTPSCSVEELEQALLTLHRFSSTERHQLRARMKKLAYFFSDESLPSLDTFAGKSKPEVLSSLDQLIDEKALTLLK